MFLQIWILLFLLKGLSGIRNVQLLVPPLLRAGGTATLLCLYDLENAPLYSVKWYRGRGEFFRFMPKENPTVKVFHIPGIYVDMFTSNEHQVTLHNLPTFVSGEVSCEITTDPPAISTASVAAMLNVRRLDIDLHVDRFEYEIGETLIAECGASTSAEMSFYVNSLRVPAEFVEQTSNSKASLNMTLGGYHFQPRGELRLQCSGAISDQYYISTKTITIRRAKNRISESLASRHDRVRKCGLLFILFIFYVKDLF